MAREVRKIAIFRPNAVGDFVFCLPALLALKKRYRNARIFYLGLAWHARFLSGRAGVVDQVIVVPPLEGMTAVAEAPSVLRDNRRKFVERMQDLRFDLAFQMYGGGRYANPLVQQFKARLSVGMRSADAAPLDRCLPYCGPVNRRLQLLELAALGGAQCWPMEGALIVNDADRQLAGALVPPTDGERLVLVQPGASDGRRRWAAQRFAAVADALADRGATVVINGSADEWSLADSVARAMRHPSINIAGQASLSALCGLLKRSALMLSNDTGPLHLALELGTPCVGVYWFTNMIESAPLRQGRHCAALSLRVHCPVCDVENTHRRCAHDVSFVDDVTLDEVAALSLGLFSEA